MTSDSLDSDSRPCLLDLSQPVRSLSVVFCLWKALLLVVISGCPGIGYDTSSSHLPFQATAALDVISSGDAKHESLALPLKFVRWDSIYFVHIAQKGYVFEQEWAFSYAYIFARPNASGGAAALGVTAVALSHLVHYLSVLVLYRLSLNAFGSDTPRKRLFCLISAALHIVSPAGAFLSAPYGESMFSFLNITGLYIYSSSRVDHDAGNRLASYIKLLLSSIFFAVATTVRSNGILSGILLAYDALLQLHVIVSQRSLGETSVRLCFTIIGGCIVALGLIIPQFLAYTAYCFNGETSRPWCQSLIPSIYGWVQSHYWGVGLFGYWTLSNLPLFLLASPMLFILFQSCFWAFRTTTTPIFPTKPSDKTSSSLSSNPASSLLTRLAIVQLVLAVLALTSYHVQIVNRISSGYPLWYWYLASWALGEETSKSSRFGRHGSQFSVVVQTMVAYALVQATLFGSFLPPA